MNSPQPLRSVIRLVLCLALLGGDARAHEGHEGREHEDAVPAAVPPPPHAAADTPQVELVAERRGADVLLYLDDYATNAPLDGLQVSVRSGARLLQAAPAGEGTYRLPGDLIEGGGDQTLAVEVHGAGVEAQLRTVLPAAAPDAPGTPVGTGFTGRIVALALGVMLLAALAWAVLRRRRGAA